MLDVTRLRVLDALARCGSVTAAAQELHYSQPTVSHHLARLEAETEPEPDGVRLHHLLDDPEYLLSTRRGHRLATLHDATWIAGCERCRSHLLSLCADAGFEPRIGYTSDDMVVMQALVAAGLGATIIPGLALRAHRVKGIVASELPGSRRHVYAATYGEPPDPPASAALLAALAEAAAA